jgi:hypothetical protein
MAMKERTLRIIIYLIGAVCLFIFISIRIPALTNMMLKEKVIPEYFENTKYGELYYFNYIDQFKEPDLPPGQIKYRFTPKHPDLNEADILTFGDSFFDFTRMTTFPERLGDTLNQRVYYARESVPLLYLDQHNYEDTESKVLIYESAERYIPFRFSEPHKDRLRDDNRSAIRKSLANLRDHLFLDDSEIRLDLLLARSYLTNWIYTRISTFKFNNFRYIPSTTPVYALNQKDPWLFYYEEVTHDSTGFYYNHTDQEIARYCDNIADLRTRLKEKYNLDMVFMGIPSKYTIYHKLLNDHKYNNFLPRLYKGLEERGVPTITVYDDYIKSKEILYYGTDTHWNKKGLDIALQNAVKVIQPKLSNYSAIDTNQEHLTKN